MKRFMTKIAVALAVFSMLIVVVYFFLHGLSKRSNAYCNYEEPLYVWGDSQMIHGLDVSLLKKISKKPVLTMARQGAGMYDLLVAEKSVRENSICIVSFSEAAFFRNPRSDNNRTGFELSCLKKIHRFGCPIDECLRIANMNRKKVNYNAFEGNHALFPYSDSIVYPEPLQTWHSLFDEEKEWFSWKAKAYEAGLQCLFDKQPQMILVQFPFDKQVESFSKKSINYHLSDSIKQELIEKYNLEYDTIMLKSDSLLMHDLSHMNKVGARLLTHEIGKILHSDSVNNYFIEVHIK
jgi:hypothetical protein